MENIGLLVIVFFLSFFVHLWSTLVGGAGAILVPSLLFLGLSPQAAVATNRFSALSNIVALFEFHKHRHVQWRLGFFLALFAGLGSALGSVLVLQVESNILEQGIAVIILLSLPMFLLKPKAGLQERKRELGRIRHFFGGVIMFFLGIIGGFFSSMGVWFSYVYIFYYGLTFIQTAATRKVAGLFMITFSLAVFIPAGIINWPVAISMLLGGSLGSWISARYAKKLGNQKIRYLFLAIMCLMALQILIF